MLHAHLKKYTTHPNRVSLDDLKVGDFFVVLSNGKYDWNQRNYNIGFDKVWRCFNTPKKASEYSSSMFATCVSMGNHVVALQTTGIYIHFGNDPLIIKLPKEQQEIYKTFYDSLEKNSDAHTLCWGDWYRVANKI